MKVHHGFIAGIVGGLMLDKEALVILVIGLGLGAAGGFAARELAGAYRWARRRLSGETPAALIEARAAAAEALDGRDDWRKPW
jgi:hypothetical protein